VKCVGCLKEEEKDKEKEGKADRVSNLKKDYTVSITNTPVLLSRLFGMFLSCLV